MIEMLTMALVITLRLLGLQPTIKMVGKSWVNHEAILFEEHTFIEYVMNMCFFAKKTYNE